MPPQLRGGTLEWSARSSLNSAATSTFSQPDWIQLVRSLESGLPIYCEPDSRLPTPDLYGGIMTETSYANRRGLTVLALVLLILALVIGAFFLIPYLQSL